MSTSLDGSPPPADPGGGRADGGGDADRPDPGGPRRRRAAGPGSEDSGAVWLQEEMRRRMAARAAHPARGRHARDEADTQRFGVDELAARLRTGPQTPPSGTEPRPEQPRPEQPRPEQVRPPQPGPDQHAPGQWPNGGGQWQNGASQWQNGPGQTQTQAHPGPAPSYQDYAGPVQEPPAAFTAARPLPHQAAPGQAAPNQRVLDQSAPGPAPYAPAPSTGPDERPAPAEPEPHPDYLAYEDYDDEDEDDDPDLLLDDGDSAPFERVLGPASVPVRRVAPEGPLDPRDLTPPPGPGGMRQLGNPLDRAGRRAPAPDTLGAPLVPREYPREPAPPTTPTGLPGLQSWPQPTQQVDPADLEATDVGGLAPIPAGAPPRVEPEPVRAAPSARTAAAPATATPVVEPDAPALSRPVGARFDARVVEDDDPDVPKRVRVVLSERKGVARTVRTVVDVQEGTAVGELLRANLIRGQLGVALRVGVVALLVLGALPVLFAFYPDLGRLEVLGLRLPWLLLGVLVYPFLLGLGWWHTKAAERVEQNFADHVQD